MIITKEKSNRVVSSHDFDSVNCTIDAEDMRYVASLLRNNYSNPTLAVVREITANALDANSEANANRKIEITIPSSLNPHFAVRDFGGGLSKEDVFGLYSKYGKSTKRESNNYIGAFGIGKFAPLSYGQNFTCVSYHGGVKTSYNIFVNDDDDTKIVELHSEPSSEPTGLSVEVAVADDDVDNFRKVVKDFFRFFSAEEMPKFIGVADDEEFLEPYNIIMEGDDSSWFIIEDNSDYWHRNHHGSHAVMGRVHYPINSSSIDFSSLEGNEERHLTQLVQQNNLYIRFPIGSLKLHHSRESLEYNKSTQKVLIDTLISLKEDIEEIAKKKLGDAEDLWDARVKYAQVVNALPYDLRNIFSNSFKWQGIKVDSPAFVRDYNYQDNFIITSYTKANDADATDGYKVMSRKENRITAQANSKLVINDFKGNTGNNLRARTLFKEDEDLEVIFAIQMLDESARQYAYDDFGFGQVNKDRFVYFSNVEKAKLQAKGRAVSGESRGDVPLFELIENNDNWNKTNSSFWVNSESGIDELENACPADDALIYVAICNYKVVNEHGTTQDETITMESFHRDYLGFKKLFPDADIPVIHGIRRKDCKKLSDGYWINWDDFKMKLAKEFIVNNKEKMIELDKVSVFNDHQYEMQNYQNIKEILCQHNMSSFWDKLGKDHLINSVVDVLKNIQGENSSKEFDNLYRLMKYVRDNDKKWLDKHYVPSFGWKDFDALCKEIKKNYPLLQNLADEVYGWQNMDEKNFGKNIIEYIKVCDIAKKCENNS